MPSRPRPGMRRDTSDPRPSDGDRETKRRVGVAIVGVSLMLTAPAAAAQEPGPIVTDRPDQTESAQSVAAGLFQLEVGWTYSRESEDGIELRSHAIPGALLRIGLGSGLEARVGFAGWITHDEELTDPLPDPDPDGSPDGAGDADLGVKWELLAPEGAGTRVALLGGITLPLGREGVGSERADPTLRLAISNDLSEQVSLGYNVGVQWETVEAGPDALDTQADFLYTVALGFGLAERVGAYLESFGFFGLADGRADRHAIAGGFTLLLSDTLQLDTSAGLGLSAAAEDWFVGAGASVRFPR